MSQSSRFPLIAVDVGNHRLKFGRFEPRFDERLPEPSASLQIPGEEPDLDRLGRWLLETPPESTSWWIGSVNRATTSQLVDWLRSGRPGEPVTLLAADDLPLLVALERPDMVGIDRLLNAVAANHLRAPDRGAVVVDVGSAITVDLVSQEGAFLGGAILPGIAMSARAMHSFTDLLPLIGMSELTTPPPAVGKSTEPAMRSGLFWGAVGAIRQLVERLTDELASQPQVFLTGGAGPAVAELLGHSARHVPHLTLAGIALTAESQPDA